MTYRGQFAPLDESSEAERGVHDGGHPRRLVPGPGRQRVYDVEVWVDHQGSPAAQVHVLLPPVRHEVTGPPKQVDHHITRLCQTIPTQIKVLRPLLDMKLQQKYPTQLFSITYYAFYAVKSAKSLVNQHISNRCARCVRFSIVMEHLRNNFNRPWHTCNLLSKCRYFGDCIMESQSSQTNLVDVHTSPHNWSLRQYCL